MNVFPVVDKNSYHCLKLDNYSLCIERIGHWRGKGEGERYFLRQSDNPGRMTKSNLGGSLFCSPQ